MGFNPNFLPVIKMSDSEVNNKSTQELVRALASANPVLTALVATVLVVFVSCLAAYIFSLLYAWVADGEEDEGEFTEAELERLRKRMAAARRADRERVSYNTMDETAKVERLLAKYGP